MQIEDEKRLEALDLGNQARILLAADKTDEAKTLLDRALALDPMCADTYEHMGAWYMSTGDFRQAKESFKKALLIDKERGETYFNLGNACLMLDQLPECLDNYNRALSAGYDQAEMQFYMALAYEESKDYEMAIRHLTRAIMKDQSIPDYKVKKAQLLVKLGREGDAAVMADELILSCPELFDGYHLRTLLLQRKEDFVAALTSAREASELFPADAGLLLDYVRCNALAGHDREAFAQLEQAKNLPSFEHERAAFGRLEAELCAQHGDLDRAVEAARETIALELDGREDGQTRQLLMNLQMAKEDYQGLYESADALVALNHRDPFYRAALYYRALALSRLNRKDEATRAYREAVAFYRTETLAQPGLLDAYLYRAMAHKDLGEYDKALEMVDFLLALDSEQAEPHVIRAEIFRGMGKEPEAKAELELAARMKPELRNLIAEQ